MRVKTKFNVVYAALAVFLMISCVCVVPAVAEDEIVTVRFDEAQAYEAAGHFKMVARGLQGARFGTPAPVSIGLSVFAPGGGTDVEVYDRTSFYMVVEGEMTIVRDEGDIVLGQYDSVYIPSGLNRGLMNNGSSDAKMLVLSPSTPSTEPVTITEPYVVRAKDATAYEAPGHFKMEAYGLQGPRFNTPADVSVSLSIFHPEGGTDVENSPRESLYMVVEGELTIARPDGDVILGQYDSIYIPADVTRGIMNNSGSDVKMLVFGAGTAGPPPDAEGEGAPSGDSKQ
jgi:quercetin dioxygenase-like cupin family protein